MRFARRLVLYSTLILLAVATHAQDGATLSNSAVVPRLVNFSGRATDGAKVVIGLAGATFAVYSQESGGSPLWIETQNIQADAKGNYTVQLGATNSGGLPLDLFTSGEARWLGVRVNGGEEQPRVLLLSVPYALKAADAETVGGLPASALILAAPPSAAVAATNPTSSVAASGSPRHFQSSSASHSGSPRVLRTADKALATIPGIERVCGASKDRESTVARVPSVTLTERGRTPLTTLSPT